MDHPILCCKLTFVSLKKPSRSKILNPAPPDARGLPAPRGGVCGRGRESRSMLRLRAGKKINAVVA